MGAPIEAVDQLVASERVLPLAARHGGIFMVQLDGVGFVREMHTMFRPEGWGREAALAMREATQAVFDGGARLITTQKAEGGEGPPHAHGWQVVGEFAEVGLPHRLKLWILTKDAWETSPAGRKRLCHS